MTFWCDSTVIRRCGDELTADELHAVLRLRLAVFVVEQECPYPELDGRDLLPSTRHLWISPAGMPVAYLRMLAEDGEAIRIGRVCTGAASRGSGLATRLMWTALEHAPHAEYVLDSQTRVRDFYARFGFTPVGEPFDEDGISHITMRTTP